MPDSTAALVSQLANPPNPMDQVTKTLGGVNALMDFRANQAAMDAYRQSIDENGNFDINKFNAIASQLPGGSWKFGTQMQQSGQGLQAQGAGTREQVQATLDQLGAQSLYLQPLTKIAVNGGTVTAQQVKDLLASMPPGVVSPTRLNQMQSQVAGMTDAQATNWVLGASYANTHAANIAQSLLPGYASQPQGGYNLGYQPNPRAPGYNPPFGATPLTMTPGEVTQTNIQLTSPVQGGWVLPDGTQRSGSVGQWMHDFGLDPAKVYYNPGAGTVSAPGAPTITVLPTQAPPQAPAPASGGGARPAPAPAPAPAPSRAPTPPTPAPSPSPSSTSPPSPPPPTVSGGPTTQGGGTSTMSPQEIQQGRDAYTAAQAEQPAIQGRIATADLALQALQNAKVGGGTQTANEVMNVLGSYSPDFLKKIIPGYDPAKAAADYQTAAKYMQQITNAGGGLPGGASTSDKLNAAAAATPNPHMQDQASEEVLRVLKAQNQIQQYIMTQFEKSGQPAAQYQKFQADWARTHDPRAFFPLTADMLGYLKKSVTGNERTTFNNTVHELVTNGAIPDPRKQPGTAE